MARVSMPSSLMTSSSTRKATGWPQPEQRWCSLLNCNGALKLAIFVDAISGGVLVWMVVTSISLIDRLADALTDGAGLEELPLAHPAVVHAHTADELDLLAV